jgi:ABC-type multidrug transport system fused ATPase/permease subunit
MPGAIEIGVSSDPSRIPWRRVIRLLRPLRGGVVAMVSLSVAGVLVGLVPPLALGFLVDALVEHNDVPEAVALTLLIVLAVVLGAAAYIASEGMYARNAGRLHLEVRTEMFGGALRRSGRGEHVAGLPSRFISDAETLEQITLSLIDMGSMAVAAFVSAVLAIAFLQFWSLAVIVPVLAAFWIVTARMRGPVASAGRRRQEELEAMTDRIARELARPNDPSAPGRFRVAAERLMAAEVRFGRLRALNLQGSGGLANLGPISVVVAAAFIGAPAVGTLISLYLLAQRVFWGFDGLLDLKLSTQSVRGAVARCFEIIDTPPAALPATARVG